MDVVYRLFDVADRLLYVGVSNQIGQRLTQHEAEKSWWPDVARMTVQRCPDRAAALAAEAEAIRSENPVHNIRGRDATVSPIRTDPKRQQAPRRTPPPPAERTWLNLTEASEHFHLHRRTIARLVASGEIPDGCLIRFGRSLRINRVELERWLASRPAA